MKDIKKILTISSLSLLICIVLSLFVFNSNNQSSNTDFSNAKALAEYFIQNRNLKPQEPEKQDPATENEQHGDRIEAKDPEVINPLFIKTGKMFAGSTLIVLIPLIGISLIKEKTKERKKKC